MTSLRERLGRLFVASALTIGGAIVANSHTASAAPACSDCPTLTGKDDRRTTFKPGEMSQLNYELGNPSETLMRDVTLHITFPEGFAPYWMWWAHSPQTDTYSYDADTRTVTVQPESSSGDTGSLNPGDTWTFYVWPEFADDLPYTTMTVSSYVTWSDRTGATRAPVDGNDIVYTPARPYILEGETSFSPAIVASGGTSVMTSKISNIGTGGAERVWFYMIIDDRLTVDQSTIPAECEYYPQEVWRSWENDDTITYPQRLSCSYQPLLAPGQSVQFSVTVTAPVTAGPEEYEGITQLSCTSAAIDAYEGEFDEESMAILRLGPATPSELKVIQLGGPRPITMPSASSEPIQPTAGDSHSITTYVYNVGTTDLNNAVTVVVTIPSGFTPTKISATTDDSGATAPVCTLATRTCVFSQLAGGKLGRIIIDGVLSPTIPHKSKLNVSATASATSVASSTDTAGIAVTSLSDVRVTLNANGAYRLGEPVAFTLGVSNLGPSAARTSVAKVTIPQGASYTSVPKGCTVNIRTMTCTWASLGVDGTKVKEFSASFGQAGTASASVVFTAASPLTKDSVTRASDSRKQASWALTRAIKSALVESELPATGGDAHTTAFAALLLVAVGLGLVTVTRRRRAV